MADTIGRIAPRPFAFVAAVYVLVVLLLAQVLLLSWLWTVESASQIKAPAYAENSSDLEASIVCELGEAKFRDEVGELFGELGQDIIAISSYPRSGNSLIRLMLEKVTGIVTGSIYHDQRLVDSGLRGEGLFTANKVVFVKTHDPMFERHSQPSFEFHKVIYLVRNPLDAIWSYFNLEIAGAHDRSLNQTEWDKAQQKWDRFVRKQLQYWKDHIQHWQNVAISKPTLVVRYEDMVADPHVVMTKILSRMFRNPNLLTWLENRLECAITSSIRDGKTIRVGGYKPRPKNPLDVHVFSPEQTSRVLQATLIDLCSLGYQAWLATHNLTCDHNALRENVSWVVLV